MYDQSVFDKLKKDHKLPLGETKWSDLKNPGDTLRGTYIRERQFISPKFPNSNPRVFDIKDESGVVTSIRSNSVLDDAFDGEKTGQPIKPGQIIVITYIGKRQTQRGMMNDFEVCASPDIVDNSFKGSENEPMADEIENVAKNFGGQVVDNSLPFESKPAMGTTTSTGDQRETLIKQKAIAYIPGCDESNYKMKVLEITGLAMIPLNYDTILSKLS